VKTVEEHLRKVVSTHQRDWDERLPIFLRAYRSSTHDTTDMTPANMIFGRELCLPCDLLFGAPPDKEVNNGLCRRSGGATTRHPPLRLATPEGGQRPHEGPLRSPGQFGRIPGRRQSGCTARPGPEEGHQCCSRHGKARTRSSPASTMLSTEFSGTPGQE
jgi:hypothetical protein